MTDTLIELTEEAFAAQFPLRTNHLNPTATWAYGESGGCLFETYGEELAFVRSQDPRTVWTLIDGDAGDQYVISGFHLVNRIGYLISAVPVPEDSTIHVHIPMQSERAAQDTAHTPEPWDYDMGFIVAPDPAGQHPDIYIAEIAHSDDEGRIAPCEQHKANARRICAAVNACQRISTEALEQGVVAKLLQQLILLADHLETPPHAFSETLRTLRLREVRATIAEANRRKV